jgi:hypothetical protein
MIALVCRSVVDLVLCSRFVPIKTVLRAGGEQEIIFEVLAQLDQRHVGAQKGL